MSALREAIIDKIDDDQILSINVCLLRDNKMFQININCLFVVDYCANECIFTKFALNFFFLSFSSLKYKLHIIHKAAIISCNK